MFKLLRLSLIVATFSLFTSPIFAAKRYLVEINSPSIFSETRYELHRALANPVIKNNLFGKRMRVLPRVLNTQAQVSQSLDNLNMLVVETNDLLDIEQLRANPNVGLVEEEQFFPLLDPTPKGSNSSLAAVNPSSEMEMPWGIQAVRAPEAWAAVAQLKTNTSSGMMGQGARVVVLDTGVDRDHPDLRDRIEDGRDFVNHSADASDDAGPSTLINAFFSFANVFENLESGEAEFANPPYEYFDQEGHGTHVAGTIAGELNNQGVVGVAPKAKILMGRVCGKFGCSTLAIVKGINWAISQKADLVSMSLGGPRGTTAQEKAMEAADQADVVTVAASGNSGTPAVSFPAAYPTCLAVGAVDSSLKKASFSQWGPELNVMGPGVDVLSTVPQGTGRSSKVLVTRNGTLEEVPSTSFMGAPELSSPMAGTLVFADLGKSGDFAGQDFKGKIALISRGEISFADKVKNAIKAGAVGVLIYNNVPGLMSGALTQDGSVVAIPVAMIEQSVGEELRDSVNNGGLATASLSTARTDYAALSGTSMATPHVAGVIALVRAANKNLSASEVREIITLSATPLEATSDNQYGSGLVNAEQAVERALQMRKD